VGAARGVVRSVLAPRAMEGEMSWKTTTGIVAGLVTAATIAPAREEKVTQAQVPPAVLQAIAAAYPGARLTGFEQESQDGNVVYEIGIDQEGKTADVSVTAGGFLVAEERLIDSTALPAAVQHALATSPYGTRRVLKVEKVTRMASPDAPEFEVVVQDGAKERELVFTAAGELKR
jgi:putative PepSY-like beta-lactamase-inhibitor